MNDKKNTKEQLLKELGKSNKRNTELEELLSEQTQTMDLLQEKIQRLNKLFDNSRDAIIIRGRDGRFIDVNQATLDIFGYTRKKILSMHIKDLYYDINDLEKFQRSIEHKGYLKDYEIRMRKKDGNEIYCSVTTSVMRDSDGTIIGYQGIIRDITRRKTAEAENQRLLKELHSMSFIDDLTGLYNRRGFFSLAQKQIETAKRLKTKMFIIFVDIDNMKFTNDTFGHREGDQALIETSEVLKKSYREADVIARMGGDEFAIIAMEQGEHSDEALYSRLQNNLDAHNMDEERNYNLEMSIGIVRFDHKCNSSIDELLSRADTLMYEDKKNKKLEEVSSASKS